MDPLSLSLTRRRLLWAAVLAGLLLAMLDQTIVGTALPRIADDLEGEHWYVWVVTAYLVPATVLIPVFARLSDRFGRRRLLLVGMALFVTGSTMCAVAQSMAQLTLSRGVQGAGAAALEALSFLLVAQLTAGERAASAQSAIAGVMAFSLVGGPLIGGLLTDHVGWRWVFLVNVPLGVVAMVVVASVLPAAVGRFEGRSAPIDLRGILLLTGSVALLLVALNQPAGAGSWTALRAGEVVLGLAGVIAFLAVERRARAPIIPLRLLTDPVIGRLLAVGATVPFAMYSCVLLLPRFFQQERGTTATESGLLVYPLLVGLLLSVDLGARLIVRRNAFRGTLMGGAALVACGALGFLLLEDSTPTVVPMVLMGVIGLGVGPALSGVQLVLGRAATPADLGAAMGTLLLARQVGGALALAASEALLVGGTSAGGSVAGATGAAVAAVSMAGAVLAVLALSGLRGRDGSLPARQAHAPASRDRPLPGRGAAPSTVVESSPG